jgi:hypothetical protein
MQLMLEYYDAYHDYNFAKIQLINCYLEVFEHTISSKKAKDIAQIITNILHQKPIFDFDVRNV